MSNDAKIPSGWVKASLGEFIEFKNGVNADKGAYGKGIKFVNVMDIFKKNFLEKNDIAGSVQITDKQLLEYSVISGDILFNRTSETADEIAFTAVYTGNETVTFGGFVIRGRQRKSFLLPLFAGYCFKNSKIRKEVIRRSQGAVRANIGQRDLSKVSILIPTKEEQEDIGHILSRWDIAIERTRNLINVKQNQFEWLKTLLVDVRGQKSVRISDFIFELSARNRDNQIDRVLSVTNSNGFILSEDQFERRIASANLSNYKIIERLQYAYNPSRINVGSVARLDNWEKGVLSPMYVVFKLDETKVNTDYFLHWLSSRETRQLIKKSAQGSVRETVNFRDFGRIPIRLPSSEEQKHTAHTLNTAQREIALLEQLVRKYQTQRHGLMQKLLTGEWRIKHGKVVQ